MNKILIVLFIFFILIFSISAKIDEKNLEKNVKESLIKQFLKDIGIVGEVSKSINETSPELMEDLKETCEKSEGIRNLIFILTILTIIGWIKFYPVGIVLTIVELFVILNYFCLFSL